MQKKVVNLDRLPTRKEIAEMKAQIRKNGFNCPLNFCCKVYFH